LDAPLVRDGEAVGCSCRDGQRTFGALALGEVDLAALGAFDFEMLLARDASGLPAFVAGLMIGAQLVDAVTALDAVRVALAVIDALVAIVVIGTSHTGDSFTFVDRGVAVTAFQSSRGRLDFPAVDVILAVDDSH